MVFKDRRVGDANPGKSSKHGRLLVGTDDRFDTFHGTFDGVN